MNCPPPPEFGAITLSWVREGKRMLRRAPLSPNPSLSGTAGAAGWQSPDSELAPVEIVSLPSAPAPWPWQAESKRWADRLLDPGPPDGTAESPPQVSAIARLVRATFGEPSIYREAAQDPASDGPAWCIVATAMVASSLGWSLLGSLAGNRLSLLDVAFGAATGAIGWSAGVAAMWVLWRVWLRSALPLGAMLRAEGFALAPAAIRMVPLIGQLAGLWTFVTSAAAKHALGGASTSQVILLTAVQAIVQTLVAVVVYSFLNNL